eukprot:Selendium_serpulae@DN6418_c0_g1_i3.p1
MEHRLPVSVVLDNVSYSIRSGKCKKPVVIDILKEIKLCVRPGEMLAIIGPSGSGKTSLLNAMAGRLVSGTVSGNIQYNGLTGSTNVKHISNFVMQHDRLQPLLTVEETLMMSAKLRMKTSTNEERRDRVEKILKDLSLVSCRKTKVGGADKKGISGGQMKRLAIAAELLEDPALLFLDEPTSGLDSALAYDTLKILLDLAKSGRTIICTVHQPRSQVFQIFDRLLVLNKGHVVYQGAAKDAVKHFADLGYNCPPRFNHADFILDLLSARKRGASPVTASTPLARQGSQARICLAEEAIADFPEQYSSSQYAADVLESCEGTESKFDGLKSEMKKEVERYVKAKSGGACGWFKSTGVVTYRGLLIAVRDPMQGIAGICVQLFLGVLVGMIFWRLPQGQADYDGTVNDARNMSGAIFNMVIQMAFGAFDSLLAFPRERALFNRETANGLYGTSSYYLAKFLSALPLQLVRGLCFVIPYYFIVGIGRSAEAFAIFVVISIMEIYCSIAYSYIISTASPSVALANILGPTTSVVFMLVSGFFLSDDAIPSWIGWLKYVSFMRYSFHAVAMVAFRPGEVWGTGAGAIPTEDLLEILQIDSRIWFNAGMILVLGTVFHVIAYLFLRFTNRAQGKES